MNSADVNDRGSGTSPEEPACQKGSLEPLRKVCREQPILTSPGTCELDSVPPHLKVFANTLRLGQEALKAVSCVGCRGRQMGCWKWEDGR